MSKLSKGFSFGSKKSTKNIAQHLLQKAERNSIITFKQQLNQSLLALEVAHKNTKNVRAFAEEQVRFKEFIALNWYFFSKITQDDIETRNKML
jgi:hypothetical protein